MHHLQLIMRVKNIPVNSSLPIKPNFTALYLASIIDDSYNIRKANKGAAMIDKNNRNGFSNNKNGMFNGCLVTRGPKTSEKCNHFSSEPLRMQRDKSNHPRLYVNVQT